MRHYGKDVPDGTWTGGLDYHAWGLSTNLFCYFTDEATGQGYRLSVLHRQHYQPCKEGPDFSHEPVGGRFQMTTGKSKKNGLPTFITARKLDDGRTDNVLAISTALSPEASAILERAQLLEMLIETNASQIVQPVVHRTSAARAAAESSTCLLSITSPQILQRTAILRPEASAMF